MKKRRRYFVGEKEKRKLWMLPYILFIAGVCIALMALVTPNKEVLGGVTEDTVTQTTASDELRRELIKALLAYGEEPIAEDEYSNEDYEAGRTVVIDAGHGGMDSGCIWGDAPEKDINLELAARLKELLEELDYQVIMTRTGDHPVSLPRRVEIANTHNAAAFVSIHQNAYEDTDVYGIETLYDNSEPDKDSYNLARLIHKNTLLTTGAFDRGLLSDPELLVTRETKMPSCLIETGYMSNSDERDLLLSTGYQEKIARGIAEGIDQFLTPKVMYLTFDDGPSVKYTEEVLDKLKARDIKATFFVIGENVRKNPELARRIVDEGHTIGIHCDRHVYKEIYASVDSYIADFNKASDTVFEVTGIRPKIFRFPGGSVNAYNKNTHKDIINAMLELGYVYFDWNACVDSAIKSPNRDTVIKEVEAGISGKNRVILLAHDNVAKTAEYLDDMLDLFADYHMSMLKPETKPIRFKVK